MRVIKKGWTRVLFFIPVRYYIVHWFRFFKDLAGQAYLSIPPAIYIDDSYENDVITWEHELQHIRQWILSLGLSIHLPDELLEVDAHVFAIVKYAKKRKIRKNDYTTWHFLISRASSSLEKNGLNRFKTQKYLERKLEKILGLDFSYKAQKKALEKEKRRKYKTGFPRHSESLDYFRLCFRR